MKVRNLKFHENVVILSRYDAERRADVLKLMCACSRFTPTLLKVTEQQLETPLALSVIQEAAAISATQTKPI
jgi:hypothetical protein